MKKSNVASKCGTSPMVFREAFFCVTLLVFFAGLFCAFSKNSFIQIQTQSSGIHAISMTFWDCLVPKIALFENFGTKNHNFRQISHQNFTNNPCISFFPLSPQNKRLQIFEAQPKGFPKTISSKVSKCGTFLKIATGSQIC